MKVDYKEIFKLKVMLDKANIPYEFYDRSIFLPEYEHVDYQIVVYKKNSDERLISVVQGFATYGNEKDLLEIMGCLTKKEYEVDTVLGWLTAKEVFKRIKKNYK